MITQNEGPTPGPREIKEPVQKMSSLDLENWFKPPRPDPAVLAQQELERKLREEAESRTQRG